MSFLSVTKWRSEVRIQVSGELPGSLTSVPLGPLCISGQQEGQRARSPGLWEVPIQAPSS